jgi:predicted Zn-dependent protease
MHGLDRENRLRLDAANGWLGLGNWREAHDEIEHISPVLRAATEVLDARFRIYEAAGKWDLAIEAASALCKQKPSEAMPCVYLARALNGLGQTKQAMNFLIEAAKHVPKEEALYYDLACYCCAAGEVEAGRKWLDRAADMGRTAEIMVRALDDPRLDALWYG